MRYMLLLLLYFASLSTAFSQTNDSLNWDLAQQEFMDGNYEKSCSLYINICNILNNSYAEIYSRDIEDLQKTYSIDELELENKIEQNRIITLSIITCLLIAALFSFIIIYFRKQNRQITRSRKALLHARKMEEESIRTKSLFLSNMSHEIRTPLNAISGFAEIVTMSDLDQGTREQCNDLIQLNSELLVKLINDVIDISCLNLSNMELHFEDCELVMFCNNVIKTVSAVKQSNATISFESDFPELWMKIDSGRLQQLLINLLINATKFTKEGSIILKLEMKDNETVQFSVTDTGCGIPEEKQKTIFKRFEKLDEQASGFGLGLSICQIIIKRLDGHIWIDTTYTQGARFIFTLPLNKQNN